MAKIHFYSQGTDKPKKAICGRHGQFAPVAETKPGDVWLTDDKAKVSCRACRRLIVGRPLVGCVQVGDECFPQGA